MEEWCLLPRGNSINFSYLCPVIGLTPDPI